MNHFFIICHLIILRIFHCCFTKLPLCTNCLMIFYLITFKNDILIAYNRNIFFSSTYQLQLSWSLQYKCVFLLHIATYFRLSMIKSKKKIKQYLGLQLCEPSQVVRAKYSIVFVCLEIY